MDVHQSATAPVNSRFAELADALGANASEPVPLEIGDKDYMQAWFKMIDAQVGGRNYWWLDSPHAPSALDDRPGAHPNAELWNRLQFWGAVNESKVGRPTVMGPWGGLGTHRYPFGHSGDTITSWQTLQFLPRYSATASNVLFSYISHDLGGHRDYGDGDNQELYTRSAQYGAFSAQLRPHAAKVIGACEREPCDIHFDRRIWELPFEFFAPLREAMQLRARLLPYSYTAAMRMYLEDVPFIRHAYVDFPGDAAAEAAANTSSAYMFGSSILVAPVTTPRDAATNLTAHTILLPTLPKEPASDHAVAWVERGSGRCLLGGRAAPSTYTLDETAEFVRAGSIIPMSATPSKPRDACGGAETPHVLGGAADVPPVVHWHVFLGNASTGSGLLIEDDGRSTGYLRGEYSTITANYTLENEATMLLSVGRAAGTYRDLSGELKPSARAMVFELHNVLAPKVLSGDAEVTWNARTLTASVRVAAVQPALGASVRIAWAAGDGPRSNALCGAMPTERPGFVALHARVLAIKKMIDWEAFLKTRPSMAMNELVATTIRMERDHAGSHAELAGFGAKMEAAVRLHTAGNAVGQPSAKLQRIMKAWLR